jgi:hypothetical protein
MTRLLVLLAVVAALFTGSARAVPPVPQFHIGLTHAQPVAGRQFTGITITNAGPRIKSVRCDASVGRTFDAAALPRTFLHTQQLRFYTPEVPDGPDAVTCTWKIPAAATGKKLLVLILVNGSASSSAGWPIR